MFSHLTHTKKPSFGFRHDSTAKGVDRTRCGEVTMGREEGLGGHAEVETGRENGREAETVIEA